MSNRATLKDVHIFITEHVNMQWIKVHPRHYTFKFRFNVQGSPASRVNTNLFHTTSSLGMTILHRKTKPEHAPSFPSPTKIHTTVPQERSNSGARWKTQGVSTGYSCCNMHYQIKLNTTKLDDSSFTRKSKTSEIRSSGTTQKICTGNSVLWIFLEGDFCRCFL